MVSKLLALPFQKFGPAISFEQPSGFGRIWLTKFWERVAYYGLQAILVLYLTEYLFTTKSTDEIWFVAFISHTFGVTGQALASTITGGFLMLVSIIPILGGFLTDRYLGPTRSIIIGGSIMAVGHCTMAIEAALLPALLCIALGVGLFRGAIASQLGALYDSDSGRVEGFQLYFLAVNLAGLAAPFVIGTIGEKIGWHWGFAAAGAAMMIALAIYSITLRTDPQRAAFKAVSPMAPRARANAGWTKNIALIVGVGLLAIPNFQLFNAYMIWVKRDFALQVWEQTVPVSWLIGLDAALSLSVLIASVPAWRWIEARTGPVSAISRASLGALFVCAAMLCLVAVAITNGDGKISLLWCVLFQLLNAVGLAQILPAAMAKLGSRENAGGSATSISGYFFGLFIAGFVSTLLAARFETMDVAIFWLLHLACAGAGAAVFFASRTTRLPVQSIREAQ